MVIDIFWCGKNEPFYHLLVSIYTMSLTLEQLEHPWAL